MAIDSIASSGAAALQPFPPRPNADAGSDNRSIQQFLQNPQQQPTPPAGGPVQPQTANAVTQPNASQNASQPRPTGRHEENPATDLAPAAEERTEQTQNSALNYSASGTPNAAQNPTQAGRRVSLSV